MEEKKSSPVNTGESKPTYEQLKNWLDQVVSQRNKVAEQLNQVTSVLNKLPWLFKVVEFKDAFSTEFVYNCTKEIEFILTPPPEEDTEESKDELKKD